MPGRRRASCRPPSSPHSRTPDPNVLRDGALRAYDAHGLVQFRKRFENKFVQPLCDTPKRLVWVEVSAKAVTRVFVRQGSTTHTVALPYRPQRASFPMLAASSAAGSRLIVGMSMPSTDRRRVMTCWLRVSRSGVPSIVSRGITDWVSASLTPSGDKAAILTASGLGDGPNWWVSFGQFHGRMLPGNDAGMLDASSQRIFEQGAYSYSSDTATWGATTVEVFDRSLFAVYKRTWTFDDDSSSIWFRHDGRIDRLAGVDNTGALTVINVGSWAITTLPGPYADAVPDRRRPDRDDDRRRYPGLHRRPRPRPLTHPGGRRSTSPPSPGHFHYQVASGPPRVAKPSRSAASSNRRSKAANATSASGA